MASAGGARDFGGLSDSWYFNHPNSFDPQNISFSYCAWVRPVDPAPTTSVIHGISGSTYSFCYNKPEWYSNIGNQINSGITKTAEWWFFCMTYRESDNNVRFYLDVAANQVTLRATVAGSNSASATGVYHIGVYGGISFPWSGYAGQISYFDRELSLSEIQELQFNPSSITDSNLQGNYPLWGVDNPELDVSGKGRNTTSTVGTPGIADTSPPVFLLGGQ